MAKKRKLEASPSADRSELHRLLDAAKADHWDDGPRLALADWLEENGGEADRARAEVIRLQLDSDAGGPDWSLAVERLREKWVREWVATCRDIFKNKLPSCERGLLVADVFMHTWMRAEAPTDEAWAWVEAARPQSIKSPEFKAMFMANRLASVPRLDLRHGPLGIGGLRALMIALPTDRVKALRVDTYAPLDPVYRHLRPGLDELEVSIPRHPANDWSALFACAGIAGLRSLTLGDSPLGDAGAAALAAAPGLIGLCRLAVTNSGVTGDGLASLGALPLRRLSLEGARFGLDALPRLADTAGRATLEGLRLDKLTTTPTARGVPLPRLRRLALTRCGLKADSIAALVAGGMLTGVRELDLSGNGIGAEGITALTAGAAPRTLRLSRCTLRDEAASRLAAWEGLARVGVLDLSGNTIGPGGVRALAASPRTGALEALSLAGNSPLAPADIEALLRSPLAATLRWLAIDPPTPTIKTVEVFERHPPPHLRELRLPRAILNSMGRGLVRLRAALPGCAIG